MRREVDRTAGEHERVRIKALVASGPGVAGDVGDELERLCGAILDEVRLSGAVVSLMTTTAGAEAVVAASDEQSRRLDEIQFSLGEGPGYDAFAAGRPVLTPDMEAAGARWPGYAPAACQAGIGASYTFPLQLGTVRFGVLTMYDVSARTLSQAELDQGMTFAQAATEILLDSSASASTHEPDPDLQNALQLRSEVYQAQGMVMVELGVSLTEALALMRAHAYATERDLTHLAVDIVAGTLRLPRGGES